MACDSCGLFLTTSAQVALGQLAGQQSSGSRLGQQLQAWAWPGALGVQSLA